MNTFSSHSLPIWSGEYCDLPLYFVLVRRYSPEISTPTQSPSSQNGQSSKPLQHTKSLSSPVPLSRRSSLVSGVSASAHHLFRKKKPNTLASLTCNSPTKGSNATLNALNIDYQVSSPTVQSYSQEMELYIYQLILSLPNAYRDRFHTPFPTSVDDYMDGLIRLLPKEWPELASSGALKRMTSLHYNDFTSFRHFLWEFRRLKLVAQSSDRQAFFIFLAIIPTDLRVAISRSGINQYSQLVRIEEYDKPDTKLMALDPRYRKPLRLDMHKDRLLFALHIPFNLFNKIIKSKHKLIDSLAMSWFQLSTSTLTSNSLKPPQHQLPKDSIYNMISTSKSPISSSCAPSYSYDNSSTRTLPFFDVHSSSFQNHGNNIISAPCTNQTHMPQLLLKDDQNASPHEVVISDNLVYFNKRLHLSQSLMASVIKHWYNCFTANIQQTDVQIFNCLTNSNFSFKPIFDFSQTLFSKPDFNPLLNYASSESFDSLFSENNLDAFFNNVGLADSQVPPSSSPPPSNTAYYKPWQIVKISYVSGVDLLEFSNSFNNISRLNENKSFSERVNGRSNRTSGTGVSNITSDNTLDEYESNVNVSRADSKASNSSNTSSNGPSLFSSSDSIQESESSFTTNATSNMAGPTDHTNEPRTTQTQEQMRVPPTTHPKDFLIFTCCETLEVYLAPVDPMDPPLAVIQTTLIPFAHRYGYPLALLTDRSAPNNFFTSNVFQSFWKAHGTPTFHQSTISSEATSISAIHIDFVKTYLACFANELQNGLFGVNDEKSTAPKPVANNQHGLERAIGPGSGYSRTVNMAGCAKRLTAALNDFIAFYDTNQGMENNSDTGTSISSSSSGRPFSFLKQEVSSNSPDKSHKSFSAFNPEKHGCATTFTIGPTNTNQVHVETVSKPISSMLDIDEPAQITRNQSITETENTKASFTLYEENEMFPELNGSKRNSIKYSCPDDFGKLDLDEEDGEEDTFVQKEANEDDCSNKEEPSFGANGYKDTIFYRTLATALKMFTNVNQMHSNKCARLLESSTDPDLHKGQSTWATAIPWKYQSKENPISQTVLAPSTQSVNTITTVASTGSGSKRLSANLSKYCDYYESLGQQHKQLAFASHLPSKSFLNNDSSRESLASVGSSSNSNPTVVPGSKFPTTTSFASSDQSTNPTPLDHVVIKGTFTAVVSILGSCEYLGIPCFLVQTDSRYAPGVAWVTGFQFTTCSPQLRSAIRAIYKSSSQDIPHTLRYLLSSSVPDFTQPKPSKSRLGKYPSTVGSENETVVADLKKKTSNQSDSSYTHIKSHIQEPQTDLDCSIPRTNLSEIYDYSSTCRPVSPQNDEEILLNVSWPDTQPSDLSI